MICWLEVAFRFANSATTAYILYLSLCRLYPHPLPPLPLPLLLLLLLFPHNRHNSTVTHSPRVLTATRFSHCGVWLARSPSHPDSHNN